MMKQYPSSLLFKIFFIFALTLQVTWYGSLWSRMVIHPDIFRPTDFSIFYTAGRIADTGYISQLYDLQIQRQARETMLGYPIKLSEVLPFNHPPLLVPILQLISTQSYMSAYWCWVLVMVFCVLASMAIINQILRASHWDRGSRSFIILCSALFYPIFISLLKGQDTAFLLFGVAMWTYGVITKKDALAGIGLALTVIRPQIAIVLAIPFIFNRRQVWWWFFGGAVILGLYSVALIGFDGIRDYLLLLKISASGEGFGMNQVAMFNFTGMVLRLFPRADIDMVHFIAWALFIVSVIGLSIWWKVSPEIRFRHIVLALILSLYVAPHLHYHDLAVLLIPIIELCIVMVVTGRFYIHRIAVLPTLISVVWLIGEGWDVTRFSIPYLIMAFIPILVFCYETY